MEQFRLFLAITLSLLVFFIWNAFFAPEPPPQSVENQTVTSEETQESVSKSDTETFTPENVITPETTISDLKEEFYTVETPHYILKLTNKGGLLTSLKLKGYREESADDAPLKEMIDQDNSGTVHLKINNVPDINTSYFVSENGIISNGENQEITFTHSLANGLIIEKIYVFKQDTFLIDLDINIKNGTGSTFSESVALQLKNNAEIVSGGMGIEGPAAFIDESLETVSIKDIDEQSVTKGDIDWVSFHSRYFMSAIIPDSRQKASLKLDEENQHVSTDFVQASGDINSGQMKTLSYHLFFGPKSVTILKEAGFNLDKAVDFGWFDIIAKPCLLLMNFIHGYIPNYGIAIIFLTIIVKLIFWPLGSKSYKSMGEMKKITPLMQEIREKYKNDKQKMNTEIMALYKTYKVNPMSGCLPMIVQMPIFIALYRMLYSAIELRHAPFFGWITDLSAPERLFQFDVVISFFDG